MLSSSKSGFIFWIYNLKFYSCSLLLSSEDLLELAQLNAFPSIFLLFI